MRSNYKNTILKFRTKVNLSKPFWVPTITQHYLFMYKKKCLWMEKKQHKNSDGERKKSISLEFQGVNWSAITKQRPASRT